MLILGIETSCDETAAALVENGTKIISNTIASSQELHIKTQGVIPEIAAREQIKCIIPVIKEAISLAPSYQRLASRKLNKPNANRYSLNANFIDAIAITVGPGLIGSLLVGVETAKTLSYLWNKPIVPVNHLVGHIYTNFVNTNYKIPNTTTSTNPFPAIVLIVSGGHTELLLMMGHGKYQWLGGTRDDAAGECFDKCARLLKLPYPGGPAVEKEAMKARLVNKELGTKDLELRTKIRLPRPMIDQDNFDFSFSGLKTALFNLINNNEAMPALSEVEGKQWNNLIPYLAHEVQEAITDVLVSKTLKAAEKFRTKSIILGGGVAANSRLKEKFEEEIKKNNLKVSFFAPQPEFCTDNAVGIASAAFFNYKPLPWQKITAETSLEIV